MTLVALDDPGGLGDLSREAFERLRALVRRDCGITLGDHKRALMRARLRERVRELGLNGYDAYADLLESGDPDRREWTEFIDRVTTNKTRFFRERAPIDHLTGPYFDALKNEQAPRTLRGWCAACSSGQEPASIVMAFLERLEPDDGWDVHVAATDLSHRMLAKAKAGVYTRREADELDEARKTRWTIPAPGGIRLSNEVLRRITYSRHDVLDESAAPGDELDFLFCRNVMIYFDPATRSALVRRLAGFLRPGGLLALGTSEVLLEDVPGLDGVTNTLYRRAR